MIQESLQPVKLEMVTTEYFTANVEHIRKQAQKTVEKQEESIDPLLADCAKAHNRVFVLRREAEAKHLELGRARKEAARLIGLAAEQGRPTSPSTRRR